MTALARLTLILFLALLWLPAAGAEDTAPAVEADAAASDEAASNESDEAADAAAGEAGVSTRGNPKLPPPPPPLRAKPPPANPPPAAGPLPPYPAPRPRPLPKVPGSDGEAPTANEAPAPPRSTRRPPAPTAADPAPSVAPELAAPPARPTRRPAAATDEPLPEGSDTKPLSVDARPAVTDGVPDSPQIGSPQGDFQRGQIRRENARRNLLDSGGASSSEDGEPQPTSAPTIGRQRTGQRLEVETGSIEEAVVVPPRVPRPAPADADTPPPSPRPPRNFARKPIADDAEPKQGDVIAVGKTGRKNLVVVKRLGGGSWGEVFIVEDQAGEISVLKQQKAWPKEVPEGREDPYGDYKSRLKDVRALGISAKDLTPEALVKKGAEHEVDMQVLTRNNLIRLRDRGEDVPDLVDFAEVVGNGRIKQKFAGATFDNLFEDVDALGDEGTKEACVRVMLKRMLEGAAALDAAGIVHRDFHPGNVALNENGQTKILDFGLAKRSTDRDVELEMKDGIGAGGVYGASPPPETRRIQGILKNKKAAPEEIEAAKTFASSPKADVYAIGDRFSKTIDPAVAFTPMLKSPRKELLDLLTDLKADDPALRPSARDALARLDALSTPADAAAEAKLREFSGARTRKALAEPAASASSVAESSNAQ